MEKSELDRWYLDYLDAFAACGRGESDARSLLAFYGVPLVLSTDDAFLVLTDEDQVVSALDGQLVDARAAGYHHSELLGHEATPVNATSAYYRVAASRHRADGAEFARLTASYLIGRGPDGLRIWSLVVHGT